MSGEPTIEELKQKIKKLKKAHAECSRKQKALSEQLLLQNSLMEASLDGIAIIDQSHQVRQSNRRFAQMLGYTSEEILKLYTWDWECEMTEAEIRTTFSDLSKTKATFESRHRRKDGTVYEVEVTACGAKLGQESMVLAITRDITERKLAEDALRESEEKYRALVDQAAEGIVLVDIETLRFIDFNDAACSDLGYSREEFASLTLFDVQGSLTKDEFINSFKAVVESKGGKLENRQRRKDGTFRDTIISNRVINLNGRKYVSGIWQDVTERKKAEEALRKGEEKFRTVANYIYNWEYWIAEDGHLVYIAPSCERITGYTTEEFYKDPDLLTKIIHPDSRENFIHHLGDVIESMIKEDCQPMNFRILTRNGEARWISHVCRNVFDQEGKYMGRRVSNVDITKRKQAETEMIEYSQRLKLATASGKLAVWDWNVKDNIMFWDDRMFDLYGVTRYAFPNTIDAWINGLHPDDKLRAISESNAACLGEKEFDTTFRVLRPDGTTKHLKGNAIIIKDNSGKAIRMIGINIDITEQIKAEEERHVLATHLQQAQKMEAIGTLAGGIAHDFNNILGAILGYAEMAYEDSLKGAVNPNDLNQVIQAGHRAKDLVKQILAFSRQADSPKTPLQPAPIIKESIKLLRSSIPTTIDIQQDVDSEANLILADATQIHQIIMNLCTNAYHAMEKTGGTLSISLKNKVLTQQDLLGTPDIQPGRSIQLSVRDTGSGITPVIQKRIFEPYFTTKETGKGTGMGLAIVHGIVKSCGGSITCHSEVGEGTVFEIILPAFVEQITPEKIEDNVIPVGTERILFVDDEEMLAKMGQTILERLGYKVTVRISSIEALAIFKAQSEFFDMVITDQTMPRMTGFDLAQRMLQIRPDMPIILCTGYSGQVSEEQARCIGIKGFAMKPLAMKDIATLIRKVLDERD